MTELSNIDTDPPNENPDENKNTSKPDKVSIEPDGLNALFHSGIRIREDPNSGLVIVIKGDPGTGKTTLCLQMAATAVFPKGNAIKKTEDKTEEKKRRFLTCEQTTRDIEQKLDELRNKTSGLEDQRKLIRRTIMECKRMDKLDDRESAEIEEKISQEIKDLEILSIFDKEQNAKKDGTPMRRMNELTWIERKIDECVKLCSKEEIPENGSSENESSENGHPKEDSPINKPFQILVVDGLNLLSDDEADLLEFQEIVCSLRKCAKIAILIVNDRPGAHLIEDYAADIVIEMRGMEKSGSPSYFIHELTISKSRYQSAALGWHQYKIKGSGIDVFPSIHFMASRTGDTAKRLSDSGISLSAPTPSDAGKPDNEERDRLRGVDLITQMIEKDNLKPGSCTVLLGPRRTMKTELSLDFLKTASLSGGKGLLVTLLDNQGTLFDQKETLCKHIDVDDEAGGKVSVGECKKRNAEYGKCDTCFSNMYVMHFRPGCITPSEFINSLESRYAIDPFDRLVFWDLTQVEDRFPLLSKESLFLPLLVDYLRNSKDKTGEKKKMITSLFMGSNSKLGRVGAAIADNVIFTWRDTVTETNTDGIAAYVDRAQGDASKKGLYFFPEKAPMSGSLGEFTEEVDKKLEYAPEMKKRIEALQGFG